MRERINQTRQKAAQYGMTKSNLALVWILLVVLGGVIPGVTSAQETGNETLACPVGPSVPAGGSEGTNEGGLEVAFTLDVSASMAYNNLVGPMKNTSTAFVDRLQDGEEATVVSYGDEAVIQQPLTTDHQAVKDAINGLDAHANYNRLAEGIRASESELNSDGGGQEVMIIITDATDFTGDPVPAANDAKANGTTIFTIALGDNPQHTTMHEVASKPSYAYTSTDGEALDEIYAEIAQQVETEGKGRLEIQTRDLYLPGQTHSYSVYEHVVTGENTTTVNEVTDSANVTSSNISVLSVDESAAEMTATSDNNTSTWVRVNATYNGTEGCTNVIVAQPTVENLELLPTIWRFAASIGDDTIFWTVLGMLAAIVFTRLSTAFGGICAYVLSFMMGWFSGYVPFGIMLMVVMTGAFLGLNLAANINYGAVGSMPGAGRLD